jgi:hypothetical protein
MRRISFTAEQGGDSREGRDQGEGKYADHRCEGGGENQASEYCQHAQLLDQMGRN